MHCTLLVPDLLSASPPDAAPYHELHLPALTRLLARGRCASFDAVGMEAWLCQAFEIERRNDWPVAPLTLMIDGGDPGDAYWLRCDPVHLHMRRNQLILAAGGALTPSPQESAALIATLNGHFATDGLSFLACGPQRWYLRVERRPSISTHALHDVIGRDIECCLPSGPDSPRWHALINEIQMLLHAHPVNQAREARGEPAVNSIWLWGGGVKPTVQGRHFTEVWASDALARALATFGQVPVHPLPANAVPLLAPEPGAPGRHLVVMPQLRDAVQYGDIAQWRATLSMLERDWFSPLHEALRRRRLSGLTLIAPGARRCLRCDITGGDLWKFWRPLRPLGVCRTWV